MGRPRPDGSDTNAVHTDPEDPMGRPRRAHLVPLLLILLAAPGLAAEGDVTVVASGLDNPRGLGIGPWGSVYVAESGSGGDGPCIPGPEGTDVCYGETGALTVIGWHGQRRIAEGLPSLAPLDGFGGVGPTDVVVTPRGRVFLLVGLGGNPAIRDDPELELPPGAADLGRLLRIDRRGGSWRTFADIAEFEAQNDPDAGMPGTEVDSNPVSVIHGRGGFTVADAGGNSLLAVDREGNVSLRAVFDVRFVPAPPFIPPPAPPIPMQSVPTSVTVGRDGAFHVGELTGFPFPEGAARIYRVAGDGVPEVVLDGFTHVIDIVFDRNGDLYVLEIARTSLLLGDFTGALLRVTPDGVREELMPGPLFAPTGLAIDIHRRALYVSNCGVCPGGGEVLRIELAELDDDEDDDDSDDDDDEDDDDSDDDDDEDDEDD